MSVAKPSIPLIQQAPSQSERFGPSFGNSLHKFRISIWERPCWNLGYPALGAAINGDRSLTSTGH